MREDEEQSSKGRLGGSAAALPGLAVGMDLLAFARYLQSERDAPAPRSEAAQADTSKAGGTKEPLHANALGRADLHDDAAIASSDFSGFASSAARSGTGSSASNGGATQLVSAGTPAPLSTEDIIKMVGTLPSIWNVASSAMPNLHTASPETDAWFSSRISLPQPSPAASAARSLARSSDEVGHLVAKSDLSAVASRSAATTIEESGGTRLPSASSNTTIIHNQASALNFQVASMTSISIGDAMRLSTPSIESAVGTAFARNVKDQSAVASSPPITNSVKSDATIGTINAGLLLGGPAGQSLHEVMAPIGSMDVVSLPASNNSGTPASPQDTPPAGVLKTSSSKPASPNSAQEQPHTALPPTNSPIPPIEPVTPVPMVALAPASEPAPPSVPPSTPNAPPIDAPVVVDDEQTDPSTEVPSTAELGTQPMPAAADGPDPPVVILESSVPSPKPPSQPVVELGGEAGQPPSFDAPPDDVNAAQPVVPEQVVTRGLPADEPISNVDVEYPLPGPGPSLGFAASLLAHLNENPSPTVEILPVLDPAAWSDSVPLVSLAVASAKNLIAEAIVGFGSDDLPPPHSMSTMLHDTTFSTTPPIFDPGLINNT